MVLQQVMASIAACFGNIAAQLTVIDGCHQGYYRYQCNCYSLQIFVSISFLWLDEPSSSGNGI